MRITYKIDREALKTKDYKKHVTQKVGAVPRSRDTEALSELIKALKKS